MNVHAIHWFRRALTALEPEDSELEAEPSSQQGFATRTRIILAVGIGLLSGVICFLSVNNHVMENWAGDFTWALHGAEYLLSGANPYEGEYPMEDPLFYPLPALFVAIPFTIFRPEVGAGLFFGFSSGLLAFAVTRYGYTYLPLFISAPFFMAMLLAQWAPLLMVAAFVPALLALVIIKPSLGFAIFAIRPTRMVFPIGAMILIISLVVEPTWPLGWLDAIQAHSHPVTLLVLPGPLILLALLCWRRREARLLLLLALIPQRLFFYDQLLLWLVIRSARQGLYFALASWLGFLGWVVTADVDSTLAAEPWVVSLVYLPATAIVLINGRSGFIGMLTARWSVLRKRLIRTTEAQG